MPSEVWAIDPGGTTGVATYDFQQETHGSRNDGLEAAAWEVPGGFDGFTANVLRHLEDPAERPSAIVIESFTIRPDTHKHSPQPDALHIIGAVRYVCAKHGVPLTFQSPADAKRFGTDEKLKAVGWYQRTPGGHQNDAARHLLTYLAKHRLQPILEALV